MKFNLSENEQREYNIQKAKFAEYYERELLPLLKQKEAVRRKYTGRFWFLIIIALLVLPILGGMFYFFGQYIDNDFGEIIFLGICAIFIYLIRAPFVKYRKEMKNDIMGSFIRFFQGFSYRYGQTLNRGLMEKSLIFPRYDILKADDSFCGRYNDIGITVCEQTLQRLCEDLKGRKFTQTVFEGIAVEMDMKKPFKGQTILLKDAGLFNAFKSFSDMERVTLEDVKFEKEFEVYSTNQIEARYILTTAFMERLLRLKELYKGKSIQISFYANKILLAIDTRYNMFEAFSFFRSNINYKKLEKVFDEFWTIFSIADILKLNQNTGL